LNRKVEQGLETRREIVEAARRLFAERGYADVSIEQVLAATGVSRGALYHHFRGKEALFEAVFEATEAEIAQLVLARSAAAAGPAAALAAGADAFLDLAREKAVRQIVLTDAPAALGWEKWRAIDAQHGFGRAEGGAGACGGGVRAACSDGRAVRPHAARFADRDRAVDRPRRRQRGRG
jgi:AcrR family transcriptional regulator